MTIPKSQLLKVLQNQYAFSQGYSPLYASLFGAAAQWLEEDANGAPASWLLEVSEDKRPLDVTLLLAAGLHRDVLLAEDAAAVLAAYYPSVGGRRQAGFATENGWWTSQEFQKVLIEAIMARKTSLGDFIQTNEVQTNETGRGIAWLLPLALSGWSQIHLVDLGASAGLNLVADKRSYLFADGIGLQAPFRIGEGEPEQFVVHHTEPAGLPLGTTAHLPEIVSRVGCDLAPFPLRSAHDEATLSAFIWADQLERMARLREGIAALRKTAASETPIALFAVDLPDGIVDFLADYARPGSAPIVFYNTYIRMYLVGKGAALRKHLDTWANKQDRPVVWIQWEPYSCIDFDHGHAPEHGWLAWTVDLWHDGQHGHWHLGWAHPHGHHVRLSQGLLDWSIMARSLDM